MEITQNYENLVQISKYLGAVIVMSCGAIGACIGQSKIASKACESLASNENAEKQIRATFFWGMIFVETAGIYCLLLALILIFL